MVLLKNLKEFCHKTSLKGIPRAAKSETVYFRCLWTTAVLGFFTVCAVQLSTILQDYFAYPTSTTVHNRKLDLFNENILPVHTICSLKPSTKVTVSGRVYPDLVKKMIMMMRCTNCTEETKSLLEQLHSHLMQPQGYFQYVGPDEARRVGIKLEDMIISCSIKLLQGGRMRNIPCDGRIETTQYVHPEFFNCYEIRMHQAKYPHFLPIGISFDIFLENLDSTAYTTYNSFEDYTQSTGIIFSMSQPGKIPFMYKSHVMVASGTHTQVGYELREFFKLGKPYGNCEDEPDIDPASFLISSSTQNLTIHCQYACCCAPRMLSEILVGAQMWMSHKVWF